MRNIAGLIIAASLCLVAFRNPPGALRYAEMAAKSASEGDSELALEYYSKAVALEPQTPSHYIARGFFLLKLKLVDAALDDFSAVIKLEPQESSNYLARGFVYSDLKREKEAAADFATACTMGNKAGCSFAAE